VVIASFKVEHWNHYVMSNPGSTTRIPLGNAFNASKYDTGQSKVGTLSQMGALSQLGGGGGSIVAGPGSMLGAESVLNTSKDPLHSIL